MEQVLIVAGSSQPGTAIFLERVTVEKAPASLCAYPDREDSYVVAARAISSSGLGRAHRGFDQRNLEGKSMSTFSPRWSLHTS